MKALHVVLATLIVAAPLQAQRGGQPPTTPDSSIVRRTNAGFIVNFDDQPLRVVFQALAEASGLNVVLTNIPLRTTTLHMGSPVTRDQMLDVIKGLAASNNINVIEGPSLVRLEGPVATPQPSAAQLAQQQQAAAAQQLFIYRLKHASAVQLAPVLQGLFAGLTRGPTAAQQAAANNPFAQLLGIATGQRGGGGDQVFSTTTGEVIIGGRAGGGAAGAAGGAAGNPAGAAQQVGRGGRGQQAQQAQALAALSSSAADIRIQAEESSNSLLIRATAADFQLIQQVLTGVDLRPLQVLIEVMIAEVTRRDDLNVGVSGKVSNTKASANGTSGQGTQPSQASDRDFILELTGGRGSVNFEVAVNMLQSRGNVRVLSLPVIIAQNNRQAVLNVGSQRPFVQVSQTVPNDPTGRVQTIQYIDVGTVLTITPTINPDGYVNLQVSQTANSASEEIQFDAPVINKREATTQIFIRDGQTTVVGGLADNADTRSTSGIPYLSKIPLIGWIFGGKQRNQLASELFLFLTPHVIYSDTDIDALREAVKSSSDLLQTVPIEARIKPGAADTIMVRIPPVRPDTGRPPIKPPAR